MAITYSLIASYTFPNSSSTSYTFTGIPQTFTDLMLRSSGRDTLNINDGRGQLSVYSNSTSSDYYGVDYYSLGNLNINKTSTGSAASSMYMGYQGADSGTALCYGVNEIYLPNYSSTDTKKKYISEGTSTTNGDYNGWAGQVGYKNSTTVTSSLTIVAGNSQNFVINTTLYLYGIKRL